MALQALKKIEPKALNLCSGSINSADAALSLFTISTRARSGVLVSLEKAKSSLELLSKSRDSLLTMDCVSRECNKEDAAKLESIKGSLTFRGLSLSEQEKYDQLFLNAIDNPETVQRYVRMFLETYDIGPSASRLSVPAGSSIQQVLQDAGFSIAKDERQRKTTGRTSTDSTLKSIEISKGGKTHLLIPYSNGEYMAFEKTGKVPTQREIDESVSAMIGWNIYAQILLESKIINVIGQTTSKPFEQGTAKFEAGSDLFFLDVRQAQLKYRSEQIAVVASSISASSFFMAAGIAAKTAIIEANYTKEVNDSAVRIGSYNEKQLSSAYDSAFGKGAYGKRMSGARRFRRGRRSDGVDTPTASIQNIIVNEQTSVAITRAKENDLETIERMGGNKKGKKQPNEEGNDFVS